MKRAAAVSMSDLARHLGLSVATVSRALRHHPAIPAQTCEAVRRAADLLGYRPNPMIAALMRHLRQRHPRSPVNLTCLYMEENATNLVRAELAMVQGFLAEAARLGYHATAERWDGTHPPEAAWVRAWRARNVRGVFLLDVHVPHPIAFPWAEFSWVVAGNTAGTPPLHRVGNEIYQIVKLALAKAVELGCRRPALAVPLTGAQRQGLRWAGAFSGNWFDLVPAGGEPLIFRDIWTEKSFVRWLRRVQPDAVLALTDDVLVWLNRTRLNRRQKPIGIHLAANTSPLSVMGVYQDFPAVGASAAQMLDSQLLRNERGVPAVPSTVTVAGRWQA